MERLRGVGEGLLKLALIAAVIHFAVMRSWTGYAGLPNDYHHFSYHPDEIFLLLPSFGFAMGDWNPHFFNYGTLYIYLVGIPAVFTNLVAEWSSFPTNLRPLYVLGRHITLAMGVGGVALLYWALRREERAVRQVGTLLLALCPLYVVHSGYATVDVPATFWLVLAYGFALAGGQGSDWKMGVLAGVATGLGAATKYNVGLFAIPVILAPYLAPDGIRSKRWIIATIGGVLIGFVIGCPFVGRPEFVQGVLFELRHMRLGGTAAFVETGPGWVYHVLHGLPVGLGLPLLAAVTIGLPVAAARPNRATRLAAVWVVLYLLVIGFGKERFIRYLIPLMPFVCVIAASGMVWLVRRMKRSLARAMAVGLGAAVIGLTACYTQGQMRSLVQPDPRDVAWQWARESYESQGRKWHVGLVQAPWYLHPPASPYNAGPLSRRWFERWNEKRGKRVIVTGWDVEMVRRQRPDVFFINEAEYYDRIRIGDKEAEGFVSELHKVYARTRVFEKEPARCSWLAPGRHWAPPDWLYDSPRIIAYYGPVR